jgi:Uma2 family endonuclease
MLATARRRPAALPERKRLRCTFTADEGDISVPETVRDLESFRAWVHSDSVPEKLRLFYLDGEVWIDMSKEQLFTHVAIKDLFTAVLTQLVGEIASGYYFGDGSLLTSKRARLSGNPDGTFVSFEAIESARVTFIKGKEGGYVELQGSPDMVLEIVSDSSVQKDTGKLTKLYARAKIPEYWLVDCRAERLEFSILRWSKKGYVSVQPRDGWVRSEVFSKQFRLTREIDRLGNPRFTLGTR